MLLIDPSYELRDEHRDVIDTVVKLHKRFATGIIAIWYPVIERRWVERYERALRATGIAAFATYELCVARERPSGGLIGSGMFVVNPPWQLDEELEAALPWLVERLAVDEGASHRLAPDVKTPRPRATRRRDVDRHQRGTASREIMRAPAGQPVEARAGRTRNQHRAAERGTRDRPGPTGAGRRRHQHDRREHHEPLVPHRDSPLPDARAASNRTPRAERRWCRNAPPARAPTRPRGCARDDRVTSAPVTRTPRRSAPQPLRLAVPLLASGRDHAATACEQRAPKTVPAMPCRHERRT